MKREMRLSFLILACLLLGQVLFVVFHGPGMSVYVPYEGAAEDEVFVTVSDESAVSVKNVDVLERHVRVKLMHEGRGSADVAVQVNPYVTYSYSLKALPLGILFDDVGGNFSGWQGMLVTAVLFFCGTAVIMLTGYLRDMKKNPFAYAVMAKLALFFYLMTLGLMQLFTLIVYFTDPARSSFYAAAMRVGEGTAWFMLFTVPVALIFCGHLTVSNLYLIRKEGAHTKNLLGIALSACVVLALIGGFLLGKYASDKLGLCLLYAFSLGYSVAEALFVSLVITFAFLARRRPAYDKDCIVIPGCKIRADGTLYPLIRGRVDRALAFAEAQTKAGGKAPVFIPSGGKGADEPVSEAEAMKNYLLGKGVAEERIVTEDKSLTTFENFRFSRDIISDRGYRKVVFSTTDYHVMRCGIFACRAGLDADGMGSVSRWYFWPNALTREYFALLSGVRKGLIKFLTVSLLITVFVTVFLF